MLFISQNNHDKGIFYHGKITSYRCVNIVLIAPPMLRSGLPDPSMVGAYPCGRPIGINLRGCGIPSLLTKNMEQLPRILLGNFFAPLACFQAILLGNMPRLAPRTPWAR